MASFMRSASCWRSPPARRCFRCPSFHAGPGEYVAAIFYVVSLLTVLSVSLAYNLWPLTPAKWILRRFDHAAIYLLIAATYTPFLTQLDDAAADRGMIGIGLGRRHRRNRHKAASARTFRPARCRLLSRHRLERRRHRAAAARHLAAATLGLILAGGIVYSSGVVVFAWKGLRFQNAVWHGFVVAAAGLHFAAVIDCLVVARL